jgi:ATP-dependent Clp protease ATP-binding subunit ClpA
VISRSASRACWPSCKKEPGAILFIDEIHTIIGAGSASGGTMDASNLIKPVLASGELRCIGSTTFQEYRGVFEKDRALARRFQKIDVVEPSIAEASWPSSRASRGASRSTTRSSTPAVRCRPRWICRSSTFDRLLPDKAIDVIDEAGARQRLLPEDQRNDKDRRARNRIHRGAHGAHSPKQVSASDKDVLRNLERNLKMVVFGQDSAIET